MRARERIEALIQVGNREWLAFDDPARIVQADGIAEVRAALGEVERLTRDLGLHAVGFVAYEAGGAFGLTVSPPVRRLPLVWFALFEPTHVRRVPGPDPVPNPGFDPVPNPGFDSVPDPGRDYTIGLLEASISQAEFEAAFGRIKAHLVEGNTYQVNFTFAMRGAFAGDPRALFADLVAAQQGRYSAYLGLGDWSICSASPELFFSLDGVTIAARPMKGTAPRGRTTLEDEAERDRLHSSAKQRAENVMIVDMVRNDLGRIAEIGSVSVPELFTAERYPTLWQMTSLVTARSTASLENIFAALHPSASVTGAPKIRTMQILTELEQGPRGVYAGAIGHVQPDGNATFNVAIRTAVVDRQAGIVSFGVGSGVVWDSDAAAEYAECLLKARVLDRPPVAFDLLETLRWTPEEGFFLLDRHLARMRDAAEYFGRPFDENAVRTALDRALIGQDGARRVRLRVARDGAIEVEQQPLLHAQAHREMRTAESAALEAIRPLRAALAAAPVDPADPFLFHKTTNRAVYDDARRAGFDETILWNPAGEVTEGLTTNIVAEIGGRKLTPPIACGLLPGTYRAELLGRGDIVEGVIPVTALRRASRIWLINSVHEWRAAVIEA